MMGRSFIILFIIALILAPAARSNTAVAVGGGHGAPGQEVELSVDMSGADPVTALELHLPLGGAMTYVEGSAATTSRTRGFTVQAGMVGDDLRLYLYSPALAAVEGGEGPVATLRVSLAETAGHFALEPRVVLGGSDGAVIGCTATGGTVDVMAPRVELRTPKIDFGHVPIGSVYRRTVEIANTGTVEMKVTGIEPSDGAVVGVTPARGTVAPGESMAVEVDFAPTVHGPHASTITVMTDAVNARPLKRWPVVEVAADPFSVNELYVGRAEGVADAPVTVALTMNNMEPIVAAQIELQLPQGMRYVEGSATMSPRSAGHTVNAVVNGRVLTIVAYSGVNAPFTGTDGELMTFKVVAASSSGWYRIEPRRVILSNARRENMTSAATGEYVVVKSPTLRAAATLDFGEQPVTVPLRAVYTIENTGQTDLTVDRVIFQADGFRTATPLPLVVTPGRSAGLEIVHEAEAPGKFSTLMNIYSNDPLTRMKAVEIAGRAYSPNTLTATGDYDPAEGFRLDIGLDNHAAITAVQFDLTIDRPAAVAGNPVVGLTDRTREGFTAMASGVGEGRYRVVLFNTANTPVAGSSGPVMTVTLPRGSATVEELGVAVGNVVLSTPEGENLTSPGVALDLTIDTTGPGDANRDGTVSAADVTTVVNHITGIDNSRFSARGADANRDGAVTSADVTAIINNIINYKE